MWPWLIGAGVLGLVALAGGSSAPAASPLPVATGGGGGAASSSNVTPANIRAAVSYALAHESNPANLVAFAQALLAYGGYAAQAAQLLAKAGTVGHGGPAPTPSPTPVPAGSAPAPVFSSFDPSTLGATASEGEAAEWAQGAGITTPTGLVDLSTEAQAAANALAATNPLIGSVTSSTFAIAVPEHPTNADIQWWVNHYAGTKYTTDDAPAVADVMDAVKVAMAHETSLSMLVNFAVMLGLAYWVQADYLVARAAKLGGSGSSEKIPSGTVAAMLAPWVHKYAGGGSVSSSSVRKAFAKALTSETNASSLLAFAAAADAIPWTDGGGALDARSQMVETWAAAGVHPAIPSDLSKLP